MIYLSNTISIYIRWCSCHLSVRKVYDTNRGNQNP